MEVLAYQAFICLTIVATRFIAPSQLTVVCGAWTVFTVVNLFYPPLIIVQVIVVWGTYTLIKPTDEPTPDANVESGSQDFQRGDQNAVEEKLATAALSNFPNPKAGFLGAMLADIEQSVNIENATQNATRGLVQLVDSERLHIDAAYAIAVQQVDHAKKVEAMEPQLRALYEKNYQQISNVIEELNEDRQPAQAREVVRSPVFDHIPSHAEPMVQARIASRVEELRTTRETFIRDMRKRVNATPQLYSAFIAALSNEFTWPLVQIFVTAPPEPAKPQRPTSTQDDTAPASIFGEVAGGLATKSEVARTQIYRGYAIRTSAEKRKIPYLVHFTCIENLRSICEVGILPVATLNQRDIKFARNDRARYDGRLEATSVSISHTNDRMFYKYRQENPSQDWVVLKLRPTILWSKRVAFCALNAADSRISKRPLSELQEPVAFEAMFEEEVGGLKRDGAGLEAYDPTDVQAEVLVLDAIAPADIEEFVFNKRELAAQYQNCLKGRKINIVDDGADLYGARAFARKKRKPFS